MPPKPASKAHRNQQRERLVRLGVAGPQLIEQVVVDLIGCGCRPREAWRLACELTQDEVAARFNQVRDDPDVRMRGSRICEYEKWPRGGVRPPVRALRTLAAIYGTTWDRLVDVEDLEGMPAPDRQAYLDISDLRHGDSLDLSILPQRHGRLSVMHRSGDDPQLNRAVTSEGSMVVREWLPISSPGASFERPGDGLPGEVTHFTGRDGPMAQLRARLDEQNFQATVVSIYAIDGMAGIGKTAFARHAARELAQRYPDGAIWVDLYGHTPGMTPREPSGVLEQMLLQLGVSPETIKADQAERQAQWRYHIHARRMLIVLDNAFTSDQVLPLLPEAPGCLVLITSRRKLTGLTEAYPISLDVLGWDEAERLFITLVGDQRCDDRDAVRQILAACGRLPLAIRLIAGRLRHHRGELLADVAADFADQTAALDALVAEHLSVRAAFEWSYRLLTEQQRRAFRLLGWHPGPEITLVVITAMANVSAPRGKQLLRELVDHNLLDQLSAVGVPGGPRYRMHDLVRLYARERADAEEPPAQRTAAVDHLADSYLAIAREADRLLRPYVSGDPGQSTTGAPILAFADASQAQTWVTAERHNLLECVQAMSPTAAFADLSAILAVHFRNFGFWFDVRCLYRHALTVYRRLDDRGGQKVNVLPGQDKVERLVGECDEAREYHTDALTFAQHLGDRRGEADALWGLGQVERLVGDYGLAREYYTQALTLARELGYRSAEVEGLRGLGQVERCVGEYGRAREYYNRTLVLARQLDYQHAEADALRGLAQIERLIGDCGQAREYDTQALLVARQVGHRRVEADALRGLGEVERLVGNYDQAREYHTQALTLARQLGYRRVEVDVLRGLGNVERWVGNYDQAREYHTQALALARQLGYRFGEAGTLRSLGEVERRVGNYDQAREYHTQALVLARQLGDRRVEADALRGLGEVERRVGNYDQAHEYHTQALTLARQFGYRRCEATAQQGLSQIERLRQIRTGSEPPRL